MKFIFTPSAKAFGATPVMRTIDVDIGFFDGAPDKDDSIEAIVNGRRLHISVIAHAAAFGLKQMLANSYASAGTAKNKDGGLLPLSERLALWQGNFDKVLDKMLKDESRDWHAVFSEASSREPADPVEAEIARIVRSKLVAKAQAAGKKLPKADSDEYAGLVARVMAKLGDSIRATAESIVTARNDVDDFDLDDEEPEAEDGGEESATE